MNTRKRFATPYRAAITVAFILFGSCLLLFGWETPAKLQTESDQANVKHNEKPDTSREKGVGFPNISLADGIDLATNDGQATAPGKLLASADFDSDGTADLIVSDSGGNIRLYHGNPEANRSLLLNAQGLETPEPFSASTNAATLGMSPDYLEAGDFNADGKKDIIAAAIGSRTITLVAGFGSGTFSAPRTIALDGNITAFVVGEIGLADGQADVAVTVTNKKGAQMLVFEHPESAFKYKPEAFQLASPATQIAIGDLNGDHYSDIAVGGGTNLTVISERGQAYPWDVLKGSGIKRPAAIVERKQMPSTIEGLAIGNFSGERQKSLAILSGSNIFRLKPVQSATRTRAPYSAKTNTPQFLPVDVDAVNIGTLPEPVLDTSASDPGGALLVDGRASNDDKQKALLDRFTEKGKQYAALEPSEKARLASERAALASAKSEKAKEGFLKTISARPSNLAAWSLETLVTDARLSEGSVSAKRSLNSRTSSSGSDDLILAGATINIFTQPKDDNGVLRNEVVALESEFATQAVLPMRINGDAMDDLVVLHTGSGIPSVVQTDPTAVIIVNTVDDVGTPCDGVGDCSLRTAITQANGQPGSLIALLIPGAGVHTITPLSQLPVIRANGTRLAAPTDNTGAKLVEITGGQAGIADGIKIRASNCSVSDLAINNFQGFQDPNTGSTTGSNSITIESTALSPNASNNLIQSNYLGTDSTGTIAKNGGTGVLIFDADNNNIITNVMSGLTTGTLNGLGLDITAGNNNNIFGNLIGTTRNGNVRLQNGTGVFLSGSNNKFGGDGAGEGNVVSGNGTDRQPGNPNYPGCDGDGIIVAPLIDLVTGVLLTEFNTFKGNRLGTSADGLQPLGNCGKAIGTIPQTSTFIGSITQSGRNIISGNGLDAIYCGFPGSPYSEGGYCAIVGNNIGTDITGTVSIPNTQDNVHSGIGFITGTVLIVNSDTYSYFGSPGGTTLGGSCTGFCNLLSGQYTTTHFAQGNALLRFGWGTVGAFNNFIGTDLTGTQSLPNIIGIGMGGALYDPTTSYIGGYGSDGNGGYVFGGNLLSGNVGSGANCGAYTFGFANCNVYNNLIGTDTTGTNILANAEFAEAAFIVTNGFGSLAIGGNEPPARNVISGNHNSGIGLRNFGGDLLISNNYIGVNKVGAPLGNEANGIFDYFGGAKIGGSPADANIIAHNNGAGVFLTSPYNDLGFIPVGVNISQNHIHDNGGLGIDLQRTGTSTTGDGPNPNDCQDADVGPNDLQNFPILFTPIFNGNGTVTVDGALGSNPGRTYRIDFYSNGAAGPSGSGEGENYIGSQNVTTNGNGGGSFTFTSTVTVPNGAAITGTATDSFGSTSEFSCLAGGACTLGLTRDEFLSSPTVSCAQPIIVNVTGDEPDADTTDGFCDVDTSNSGLQCTLRAAIEEANARPGFDTIEFNIPGSGVQTISPASQLPDITQPVSIRGESQPGYPGTPIIEISGINAGSSFGIVFAAGSDGSRLGGVTVNRFFGSGVYLFGNRITVYGSYLGINPDGLTIDIAHPQPAGVVVQGSGNHIGDSGSSPDNLISGNNVGILISTGGTNEVTGNYIGTDKNGNLIQNNGAPYGGNGVGIIIAGSNNNTIGGSDASHRGNVISGNLSDGVAITENSTGNRVIGNLVGTDPNGAMSVHNGRNGVVLVTGATGNTVGGLGAARNVISGQDLQTDPNVVPTGVLVDASAGVGNSILGNVIGLSSDQHTAIPNIVGVVVNAGNTSVGSLTAPNVIAGNIRVGITAGTAAAFLSGVSITGNRIGINQSDETFPNTLGIALVGDIQLSQIKDNAISGQTAGVGLLIGIGATNNTVARNKIGTDANGFAARPNGMGIAIVGASQNSIIGNLVSGNTTFGISISGNQPAQMQAFKDLLPDSPTGVLPAMDNKVQNNLIGTNVDGTSPIGNGLGGIALLDKAQNNLIGGSASGHQGNVISGNINPDPTTGYGVFIGSRNANPSVYDLPSTNKVQGNRIGLKKSVDEVLGNTNAIYLFHATNNIIGGDTADLANIIGGSTGDGVVIKGNDTMGNIVKNNLIGTTDQAIPVPNQGNGITLRDDASQTEITENTISGNNGNGIQMLNLENPAPLHRETGILSFMAKIQKNSIGIVKLPGGNSLPLGNLNGILASTSRDIYIGNLPSESAANLGNTISGNRNDAVWIKLRGTSNAIYRLQKNIIGGIDTPTPGFGNAGNGIKVEEDPNYPRPNTRQDKPSAPLVDAPVQVIENTMVSNGANGVFVDGIGNPVGCTNSSALPPSNPEVQFSGNLISLQNAVSGLPVRLANAQSGILLNNANGIVIGKPTDNLRNIVSGSVGSGIKILGESTVNAIKKTIIGTIPGGGSGFGNGGGGILVTGGARLTEIGGTEPDAGNIIAENTGPGVWIDPAAGGCNLIDPNSIYGNSGLGIDIGPLGHNPNDSVDADEGPNRLQNYPEISQYSIDGSGHLNVTYFVDSVPGFSNYGPIGLYVEFFKADISGQGETFLNSDYFSVLDFTNGGKTVDLGDATVLGFTVGDLLTSSVTDANGNTSEFFPTGVLTTPTPTTTSTNTPTNVPTDTPTSTPTATPTVPPSITGTVTYGNAIGSPSQRFVANVLLSGAGSISVSALTTFPSGAYSLSGFGGGAYTITPSKTGGANAAISSFDAAKVAQHVVGPPFPYLGGSQLVVADVSGNSEISSFDAAEIAHYVVSNTPVGASGTWKFSPTSNFHASIISSITGEDYTALLFGDVSGNWDDPTSLPGGRPAMQGGPERNIGVTAPNMATTAKHEIIIPIQVDGIANKGIIAYEFDLRYDPLVLKPQTNTVDLVGSVSRGMTAVFNTNEPGLLKVAVYGPMPITGNGVLLNLRFMAVGVPGSSSPLIWQRLMFNEGDPILPAIGGQVEISSLRQIRAR
ncbi:MAG: VCBS repeat-containing protein [Chloracidobacterium sp.]|nr:VCBS repeat-containing protein [Chloracidobacterium sp.]